ncbi:MAG: MFS transporter [Steroidobacteraceae bacterium]
MDLLTHFRTVRQLMRGYPLRVWLICFGAYLFSQMDLAMWGYALPLIRKEFDLSRTQLGLMTGVAFVCGGLGLVALGNLADRAGRRRMLMLGTVLSSLFVSAHSLVRGVFSLTLVRAASLATGGLLYPATGALIAEEAPARVRGFMAGLLQIAYPIGWFLASLIGLLVLERFGWRAMFVFGLASLPFVFVIQRGLRESQRFAAASDPAQRAKIGELFAPHMRRRSIALFLAQYCFVIAYGGAFIFAPLYFHEARGFDIGGTSVLVGLANLIGVLGYVLAAWVGEFHLTRRTTTVLWTFLGGTFYALFLWLSRDYLSSLIGFSCAAVFLLGTAAVKFAFIAEMFPTRLRATGISVCGSLPVNLGQATGPLLIGWLSDHYGWTMAMAAGTVLPLFTAGFLYLTLQPVPSGIDVDEIQQRLGSRTG